VHDRTYGAKTRWRDQIAFPQFLHATGTNLTPKPDDERKALFKGLFRGVGKYYTGVEWTWCGRFTRTTRCMSSA